MLDLKRDKHSGSGFSMMFLSIVLLSSDRKHSDGREIGGAGPSRCW